MRTTQGNISIWDSNPDGRVDDPTILFLHGHCTNKSFFSSQIDSPLLTKYRLITLDLPGYGESDPPKDPQKVYSWPGFAEIVAELIHNLNIKNILIAGWSLGGHVGLELTSRLDQLKGLLIWGTPPIEVSEKGLGQGFKVLDPKILECFGKGNLSEEDAQLMATISGYDYSEGKRFLVDAILNTDEGARTIYPASIAKGVGENQVDIVGRWSHPIAVVTGENEIAINNDYIIHEVEFANLWKNKVHVIQNAGHALHMEKPEVFNRILSEFAEAIF